MTDKVLITISGLHTNDDDESSLESTSVGDYSFSDGFHTVKYTEAADIGESSSAISECTLRLSEHEAELHKEGTAQTHMRFVLGQCLKTNYSTPYGDLSIGFDTKSITLDESEDLIRAGLSYTLSMNGEFASECAISITIQSTNQ